jgi:hypothetical protein
MHPIRKDRIINVCRSSRVNVSRRDWIHPTTLIFILSLPVLSLVRAITTPSAKSPRAERPRRMPEQVRTSRCSLEAIMSHPNFARGLDDIRNGRPFDTRIEDEFWAYERGRQFGAIAPLSTPLKQGAALNPAAVRLCEVAFDKDLIR